MRLILSVMILGMAFLGAQAHAETWTGCVNKGGQLKSLAQGDAPLRPCGKHEHVVHLSDLASKQNTQANYEMELICNALNSAGAQSDELDALGCATGNELAPDGDVMRVPGGALLNENSEPVYLADCSNDPGWTCFRVDNAFIGKQFQVPNLGFDNLDDDGACPEACENDDRCFLAWLQNTTADRRLIPSLVCHLYYRSEKVGFIEHVCGSTRGGNPTSGISDCRSNMDVVDPHWYRLEQ